MPWTTPNNNVINEMPPLPLLPTTTKMIQAPIPANLPNSLHYPWLHPLSSPQTSTSFTPPKNTMPCDTIPIPPLVLISCYKNNNLPTWNLHWSTKPSKDWNNRKTKRCWECPWLSMGRSKYKTTTLEEICRNDPNSFSDEGVFWKIRSCFSRRGIHWIGSMIKNWGTMIINLSSGSILFHWWVCFHCHCHCHWFLLSHSCWKEVMLGATTWKLWKPASWFSFHVFISWWWNCWTMLKTVDKCYIQVKVICYHYVISSLSKITPM